MNNYYIIEKQNKLHDVVNEVSEAMYDDSGNVLPHASVELITKLQSLNDEVESIKEDYGL